MPGLATLVGAAATAAGGFGLSAEEEELQKALDASIEREYRTKHVRTLGRDAVIVLQNENGPCPLLAIGACCAPPRSRVGCCAADSHPAPAQPMR